MAVPVNHYFRSFPPAVAVITYFETSGVLWNVCCALDICPPALTLMHLSWTDLFVEGTSGIAILGLLQYKYYFSFVCLTDLQFVFFFKPTLRALWWHISSPRLPFCHFCYAWVLYAGPHCPLRLPLFCNCHTLHTTQCPWRCELKVT